MVAGPRGSAEWPWLGGDDRPGFALVLVVLMLVLISMLAGWMVLAAIEERRIARAHVDILRSRMAAESAARLAALEWDGGELLELLPGQVRELPLAGELAGGGRFRASAQRLAPGSFLIRGKGEVVRQGGAGGGNEFRAVTRVGLLVRTLEPEDLLGALPAAVVASGPLEVTGGTRITAGERQHAPAGWPGEGCGGGGRPAIATADPDQLSLGAHVLLEGEPPVLADSGLAAVGGGFPYREMAVGADRTETGSLYLSPAYVAGDCDVQRSGNWGAPLDPGGPCGDYFPLIHVPGDLQLTGGEGQGILIVDGNLEVTGGVQFFGAVFVGGSLDVAEGARLHGGVRLSSTTERSSIHNSLVSFDRCVLQRTARQVRAFTRAYRHPARDWIPLF